MNRILGTILFVLATALTVGAFTTVREEPSNFVWFLQFAVAGVCAYYGVKEWSE